MGRAARITSSPACSPAGHFIKLAEKPVANALDAFARIKKTRFKPPLVFRR